MQQCENCSDLENLTYFPGDPNFLTIGSKGGILSNSEEVPDVGDQRHGGP